MGDEGTRARRPEHILRDTFAGFGTLAADRDPHLLVGLFVAQTFVRGLLNVLIVVTALELLDLGGSGVGFLNAAFGVGVSARSGC